MREISSIFFSENKEASSSSLFYFIALLKLQARVAYENMKVGYHNILLLYQHIIYVATGSTVYSTVQDPMQDKEHMARAILPHH